VSCGREGFDTQLHTGRVISSSLTSTSVVLATVNNEASSLASPVLLPLIGLLRFELLDS